MKRTTAVLLGPLALFLFFMLWDFRSPVAQSAAKRGHPTGVTSSRAAGGGEANLWKGVLPARNGSSSDKAGDDDLRVQRRPDAAKGITQQDAGRGDAGDEDGSDPDLPPRFAGKIDRATYLQMREEYIARRRGIEPGWPYDPEARGRAIRQMEQQESRAQAGKTWFDRLFGSVFGTEPTAASWTPLGPAPLPNGHGTANQSIAVSGRATAVVVDPTNSNKIYLGTAQGGVWRSLDGGATWATIFDNAQSLAIGALALAPSSPTTLYVGTGEPNQCADCFFGAGLYRIDNADTSATLVGPINPSVTSGSGGGALTYNAFTGRAISKILVHPTDAATIFVSTALGFGGSGANSLSNFIPPLGLRGILRSTNATSAAGSVSFAKLVVTTDSSLDSPGTGNASVIDVVMEPNTPSNLVAAVIGRSSTCGGGGSSSCGGIYRTTNALDATPSFTQVQPLTTGIRISLAINKVSSNVTVYAATSEPPTATPGCTSSGTGAVRKSIDGGATWSGQLTGGGGFCGGQCFYDMPIAVDPGDANIVYLGGQTRSTCSDTMKKSTDGGATFTRDDNGLHADSHALFFDGFGNILTGNDGGVWKRSSSAAAGSAWTNLNNASLNTLQFEGIAVHPLDRNLMIGGTQDNGTEAQQTSAGNWTNAEGGDGGYALIDQSATNTTNVTMYHTFFNFTGSQIGFDRIINTSCLAIKDSWPTRGAFGGSNNLTLGCDGTANYIQNGINITDNVLFYAPMALGPGTPNTLYFGTDRLYRSTDRGDSMTVVSQASISSPGSTGSPVSTIAVSPQDDNYRIVGLKNGQVWATSTGSSTLVNITSGSFPANPNGSTINLFVGRAMIDPINKNVAYVTFSFFAPAGQGVWKITNLGPAGGSSPSAPSWSAAGNGIPSIPINAFAIDPLNSNNLFAGTDIGVYNSTDGGASWAPFGTGLPRVAVFDMAIQGTNHVLRIGTHGRGV